MLGAYPTFGDTLGDKFASLDRAPQKNGMHPLFDCDARHFLGPTAAAQRMIRADSNSHII